MKVSLVAMSTPVVPGLKTAEDLIVYTARVSNPNNQLATETGAGLLKYCLRQQHWSVFEVASMTVEIETSRAISAQILRHRSFTFQEFSQRYANATQLGFEEVVPRRQDLKNRQSSLDDLSDDVREEFWAAMEEHQRHSKAFYERFTAAGVAKECARFFLPLSTATRLYMTGCARSWITYLRSRCDISSQKEHRDVAEAIKRIFIKQFPVISEALEWS